MLIFETAFMNKNTICNIMDIAMMDMVIIINNFDENNILEVQVGIVFIEE